jgi:hypothetical protein
MFSKNENYLSYRRIFLAERWPLFTQKDIETLVKHPENMIIKLQKYYHYSKHDAYEAYFQLIKFEKKQNLVNPSYF